MGVGAQVFLWTAGFMSLLGRAAAAASSAIALGTGGPAALTNLVACAVVDPAGSHYLVVTLALLAFGLGLLTGCCCCCGIILGGAAFRDARRDWSAGADGRRGD